MKLEDAIEIVLNEARSNGVGENKDSTLEACDIVEDFFVNNILEDED